MAVQNAQVNNLGINGTIAPTGIQFTEMYGYTQPGQASKKRLQVNETLRYGSGQNVTRTLNLDAAYTYDNEGKVTSVNYPTSYSADQYGNLTANPGPTYTYSFDSLDRPVGLTDNNNNSAVSAVTYNPANQVLTMLYFGFYESRQYNAMGQMTSLGTSAHILTYTFPSSTNNGKISSQNDNWSGETVTYQYDSLNRLISANGSGWGQGFGYDGFGNLVSKTVLAGSVPTMSVTVDPTTNRVNGPSYDANGNQTSVVVGTSYVPLGYDAENRMTTGPGALYAYDSKNKRVWKATIDPNTLFLTGQEVDFFGVDGQKLGVYNVGITTLGTPQIYESASLDVYFGARRVGKNGGGFVTDRLGSVGTFYPYGEERPSATGNNTEKFTGYYRDSETGIDYADQRYHNPGMGRFMTSDHGSPSSNDPVSWNRYSYVGGDPVNRVDPTGNDSCDPFDDTYELFPCEPTDGGGFGLPGGCMTIDSFGNLIPIDCNALYLINIETYGTSDLPPFFLPTRTEKHLTFSSTHARRICLSGDRGVEKGAGV